MTSIHTPATSIDRKLHRVVLNSDPEYFKTAISLARTIADQNLAEFSYQRENKIRYATPMSISKFISYSREVGLLDENLASAQLKTDIRALDNFQSWLKNQVMIYLETNNASLENIKTSTLSLFTDTPYTLPTPVKVHEALKTSISLSSFRMSLKIISALSPKALKFSSRKLVIHPEIIKG
jgi:hypothetical protein